MSGVFILQSIATGKCLDSNHNGNVYTLCHNHGNYQKWDVIQSGKGWANLRNVATGRYLDSDAAGNIYTLPANGGNYQKWRVEGLGN
jgi:hypothetical protein